MWESCDIEIRSEVSESVSRDLITFFRKQAKVLPKTLKNKPKKLEKKWKPWNWEKISGRLPVWVE